MNTKFLQYELFEEKTKVVRNKKYVEVQNKYHTSVINGFELTHHDVISDIRNYNIIKRRCERIKNLKNKNIIMVYHHRLCEETDINLLVSHILQLEEIYINRGNTINTFVFTQVIIPQYNKRKIKREIINGVHFYTLYTTKEWYGDDQEVFWARCDDDLLKEMIDDIKHCKV